MTYEEKTIARLDSKLELSGDCLIYTGYIDKSGYGMFSIYGSPMLVHRASYILFNGPIPNSLKVRHTCDNTICCTHEHLILGTHKENMSDKVNRGRSGKGIARGGAKGESHGSAKLSEHDVKRIRKMSNDGMTYKDISAIYNVDNSLISKIIRRKIWKDVS